ncbi:hypothetical protein [Staphylococcus epidermidis]|nr:hypothetical protein [Staphylococcus epidermidis]
MELAEKLLYERKYHKLTKEVGEKKLLLQCVSLFINGMNSIG